MRERSTIKQYSTFDRSQSVPRMPSHEISLQEIFGPVLTVYAYPDDKYSEVLELVDTTSPFGLTGSIYSKDQ